MFRNGIYNRLSTSNMRKYSAFYSTYSTFPISYVFLLLMPTLLSLSCCILRRFLHSALNVIYDLFNAPQSIYSSTSFILLTVSPITNFYSTSCPQQRVCPISLILLTTVLLHIHLSVHLHIFHIIRSVQHVFVNCVRPLYFFRLSVTSHRKAVSSSPLLRKSLQYKAMKLLNLFPSLKSIRGEYCPFHA